MKCKTKVIFAVLLCIVSFPCFSHSSAIHNNQLIAALYGYEEGWTAMKIRPASTKVPYYLISDAAYIAIDYNGSASGAKKLTAINDNLKLLGKQPLAEMEWDSLGGGKHRAYNHQGFYFEYTDDSVKARRWTQGRDLLVKVVGAALGIDALRAEIVANEVYTTHMLGDLEEGSIRSIKQHGRLQTISGTIDDFADNLTKQNNKTGLSFAQRESINRAVAELRSVSTEFHNITTDSPTDVRINSAREARDKVSSIVRQMNAGIEVDFNYDQARKINKINTLLASPAINIGGAAFIAGGMSLLSQGLLNGFDSINWTRFALDSGIGLAGSALDYSAGRMATKLTQSIFKNTNSLGSGVLTAGFAVAADSLIDVGFNMYGYFTGQQTGKQTLRNSALSLTGNGLAYAASIGINAGVAATTSLLSTALGGAAAGSVLGPVGNVVGFVLTAGTYIFVNNVLDDVISYFDLAEIKDAARSGPEQIYLWTNEYFE